MNLKQFTIFRKPGFILNPDDKIVNGVIKGIDRCKGLCPCYHAKDNEEIIPEEDLKCPCKQYREQNICRCNLYIREEIKNNSEVEELKSDLAMTTNAYKSLLTKYKDLQSRTEREFVY